MVFFQFWSLIQIYRCPCLISVASIITLVLGKCLRNDAGIVISTSSRLNQHRNLFEKLNIISTICLKTLATNFSYMQRELLEWILRLLFLKEPSRITFGWVCCCPHPRVMKKVFNCPEFHSQRSNFSQICILAVILLFGRD